MVRALSVLLAIYSVCILISMAFMSVGAGTLALLGLGIFFLKSKSITDGTHSAPDKTRKRYLIISILLAVAISISLILGQFNPVLIDNKGATFFGLKDFSKLWYLAWPVAMAWLFNQVSGHARLLFLRVWIAAFFIFSIIGIIQYLTGFPIRQEIPLNEGRFHASLFFGHHLSAASILIFPYFAALDFLFGPRANLEKLFPIRNAKLLFSIGIGVGSLTLFLTYSRALWIALPIGILCWAALRAKPIVTALSLFVTWMAILIAMQFSSVHERLNHSMGRLDRQQLWDANFQLVSLRPFFGVGFKKNETLAGYYLLSKQDWQGEVFGGHAHNNFIEMASGTGLVGLVLWLAWVIYAIQIQRIGMKHKTNPIARGMIAAWVVFLINGMTQVNFWDGKVLHQIMWITAIGLFYTKTSEEFA